MKWMFIHSTGKVVRDDDDQRKLLFYSIYCRFHVSKHGDVGKKKNNKKFNKNNIGDVKRTKKIMTITFL